MRIVLTNKDETLLYGYLDYDINIELETVLILDLLIYKSCRGKGYGNFLIQFLYNHIVNNHKEIKKITLVDCTSRYRKQNNIYIKLGFKYIDDKEPDMEFYMSKKLQTKKNKKLVGNPVAYIGNTI
jgi:GNAT superfamily N-acetyltransferase